MRKLIFIPFLILLLVFSCKEPSPNLEKKTKTVTLKGVIANYEQDTLYMQNYTALNGLFKQDVHAIPLKSKNKFSYTFELDEPAYFRIGRTFLYLSPGDSLTTHLDTQSRATATFNGKGAEANSYLTSLPYPKGGSFWGSKRSEFKGETISYKDLPAIFQEVYDNKLAKLNALTNVSEDFKELERARLKFGYVNTLNSIFYLYFPKVRKGEMTKEEMQSKIEVANSFFVPFKKSKLDDFNDTDYLQLEVFQSLLYSLKEEDFRKKLDLPELNEELQEYLLTANLISAFNRNGYTRTFINTLQKEKKNIENQAYIQAIEQIQNEYEPITEGKPAPDLTFTKLDGSKMHLSDYKGKVIVIDLWATWCGPCMNEKPYFEALEEQFNDKNVVFISLSIDTKEVWKNYFQKNEVTGNQLHIYRSELSEYKVVSIPRFFVIDEDLKIVDVFAPVPSTGKLEILIEETLEG